jgi:hypothetical protein
MDTWRARMVRVSTLLGISLTAGCIGGGGGKTSTTDDGLTTTRFTATTANNGIAKIEVEVDGDVDVFHVYAESDEYVSVEEVIDPDGDTVLSWRDWDGDESLTGAVFLEGSDTILNWPVREADGPLSAGTWTVKISAVDSDYYYVGDVELDITVQTRSESDGFSKGTIYAEIVYAEDVGEDEDVVAATEAAVARWEEIWGDYGLTLKASYRNATDLDTKLTDLSEGGSSSITEQSAKGTSRDIMVLIGEKIGNLSDVYGISGGIPGTPVEGPRSAVVISWLANAGADGSFSDDDIRLYGETLAHEVGHYAGLFHPVEDGWQYYDAVADTSNCTSTSSCEADLGDNLMFPYPVCGFSDCTPQDQLSTGQADVMQRYIGTL